MKKRNFRRRVSSSSSEESLSEERKGGDQLTLAHVKELQRLRQRPKGLSAAELAAPEAASGSEKAGKAAASSKDDEPYAIDSKVGGMVDMKKLAKERPEEGLSKNFAAETNRRDEDANMLKFIETELAKRRGEKVEEENGPERKKPCQRNVLEDIDESLRPTIAKRPEGMLSAQMLMGIPEVDLGIQAKIRNIEATEEAKQHLLKEQLASRGQRQRELEFVPTNMAVNFVQHSRWNNQDTSRSAERKAAEVEPPKGSDSPRLAFRVGDYERLVEEKKKALSAEKSSDDALFSKFRAQEMQRRGK